MLSAMNSKPIFCGCVPPKLCLGEMSVRILGLNEGLFFVVEHLEHLRCFGLGAGPCLIVGWCRRSSSGFLYVRMDFRVAFVGLSVLKGLSSCLVVENSIAVH